MDEGYVGSRVILIVIKFVDGTFTFFVMQMLIFSYYSLKLGNFTSRGRFVTIVEHIDRVHSNVTNYAHM